MTASHGSHTTARVPPAHRTRTRASVRNDRSRSRRGGTLSRPERGHAYRRIAGTIRKRRTIAELSRLDDHMLADIGINREQIPMIAQGLIAPSGEAPRRTIIAAPCPTHYHGDPANDTKPPSIAALKRRSRQQFGRAGGSAVSPPSPPTRNPPAILPKPGKISAALSLRMTISGCGTGRTRNALRTLSGRNRTGQRLNMERSGHADDVDEPALVHQASGLRPGRSGLASSTVGHSGLKDVPERGPTAGFLLQRLAAPLRAVHYCAPPREGPPRSPLDNHSRSGPTTASTTAG